MKKTMAEKLQSRVEKWNLEVKKKTEQMQLDAKNGNYARAYYLQTQVEIMQQLITDAEEILAGF